MIIFLPPRYDENGDPIPYGLTLGDLMDMTWKDWLQILGGVALFFGVTALLTFLFISL